VINQNWAESRDAAVQRAGQLAEHAVLLDPRDARILSLAGHIRAELQHRVRDGIALHERALALNPNLAIAWNLSGLAHAYLGELDEAERRIRHYKALSPLHPGAALFDTVFAVVALLRRDHEAAVEAARVISEVNPILLAPCPPYLAALGHLGQRQAAAGVLRRLQALDPGFSVARFLATSPFERAEDTAHYAAGLWLAGVPEGDETGRPLAFRGLAPVEVPAPK
jgi:tetratricopeptide (TPR) repeat protein